jgi:hypothetical protein
LGSFITSETLNYCPNKLYTTRSPITAMASAKTKAKIIEIKILGAAEGFLPMALTPENPTAAITPEGPKVLINIIRIIVIFFICLSSHHKYRACFFL